MQRRLERIEDRLRDAPPGLHAPGSPASPQALAEAGLDEEAAAFWAEWDGLELGHGEALIHPLAALVEATREVAAQGLLREGDRVVGEQGRGWLVLPSDPWEEGAGLLLVEEDGERIPLASTLSHFVLVTLGVTRLLYDEEGEFREGLIGEDGALTAEAERQLCRRALDLDEDAPEPRFRLAQLLRRAGELVAARRELRATVERAPHYVWAQLELGRVELALGKEVPARAAFARAARAAEDPGLEALCLAWQARVDPEGRPALATRVRGLYPGFAMAQEAGAREALAEEEPERARGLVALGLAVEPKHLGLLELRRQMDEG